MSSSAHPLPCVVMIVPQVFHLGGMGSTRRVLQLAAGFRELGFGVALLTGMTVNDVVQCEFDAKFPGRVLRTRHSGDYPRMLDRSPLLRRALRAGWKLRGEDTYWAKLSWGWADRLDIDWAVEQLEAMTAAPVLVWGISGGYLDGGVAAERIAERLQLPWILEMQDPPRRAGLGPTRQSVRARFERLLHFATGVVVLNATYGSALEHEHAVGSEKLHVLYEHFEGSELVAPRRSEYFRLVYAGSLQGGRTLNPILRAMEAVASSEPQLLESCRLCLVGGGPGFDDARKIVETSCLKPVVEFAGQVPPEAASALTLDAEVTIVIQAAECTHQIPGKVFESLRTRRPVIGVMPSHIEAAAILRNSGLGFIHEESDISGLAATIQHLWSSWREGCTLISPDERFIREFSSGQLPMKLGQVLRESGVWLGE